ncbi:MULTISPECIES: glycosyltransferase [Sphingomonas]|uniref:glycosyltransferase n=1 Tax=Sphingomonas TaxID=13687 RepID=UPI000DEF7773|nr:MULTISPECIES: glycosyltransferase [Sphingomonas]
MSPAAAAPPRLLCDLTQSWSAVGGGVGTYLRAKRAHILAETPHRHLMILPGDHDGIEENDGGRAITVWIKSPHVPFSPNYRLLLRNGAVRAALERFQPDVIECQDAYNLPWVALGHRRRFPDTAVVAGYMTDFPTVYAERPLSKVFGQRVGRAAGSLCYSYCGKLYRQFDAVYALSDAGGGTRLRALGVDPVHILPLGVALDDFGPDRRDPALRAEFGLRNDQPLLIYVGRMDVEKRPDVVVEAFRQLARELDARLVLLGQGPMLEQIAKHDDPRIIMPGFVTDRTALARWLASSDIYVSAMANETFGVSVIEAQASGLPVVGVNGGAMPERVRPGMGLLGPVGDAGAMAANIVEVWQSDRIQMGRMARDYVAGEFTWRHSMDVLFGEVIPAAQNRRRLAGRETVPQLGASAVRI